MNIVEAPKPMTRVLAYKVKVFYWLILCFILLFAQNSNAQSYVIQDATTAYHDLRTHISFLQDEQNLTLAQIQSGAWDDAFISHADLATQFQDNTFYWGKFSIENAIPDQQAPSNWSFLLTSMMTYLDFYVPETNTAYQEIRTGTSRLLSQNNHDPFPVSINLVVPKGERVTFYFKMMCDQKDCEFIPQFGLEPTMQSLKDRLFTAQTIYVFVGFFLMMLIYSFILYVYLKDKTYLYYSAYVFSILFYVLYTAGISRYLFLDAQVTDNPNYVLLFRTSIYIVVITYILFMQKFLDTHQFFPRWQQLFRFFIGLGVVLFVVDNISLIYSNFNRSLSNQLILGYILMASIGVLAFLSPLYQSKQKRGFFLIVGLLTVCTTSIIGVISFYNYQETTNFLNTALTGFIIEIIVFSIGLAYRQKEIQDQQQATTLALTRSQLLQEKKEAETTRLKELNELKTKLYTNITHEFRTPLTVIEGITKELEGNEEKKKMILRNSQNLLHLVNQMLDLSKLESGQMPIQLEQADIISYLQYIIESFQSYAKSQQIQLHFISEEEQLMMDFDADKLLKIISNLLSNAIKYTPARKDIYVKTAIVNQQFKISIQDKGIGIPANELPHIFNRFYQSKQNETTQNGTGVGLALTKELTELLEGTIQVKSTEGKGSIFTLLFPIHRTSPIRTVKTEAISLTATSPIVNSKDTKITDDKPIVLVIEDNTDVAYYIETCLKDNYQTIFATDGAMGIEKAIATIPDIIISDVMMPKADGYEVCATLKKDERTSHIPIILLTAKADQDSKLFGLERGADAYLAKPFDRIELEIRLEKLIELRKMLQARYQNMTSIPHVANAKKNKEDAFLVKVRKIIITHLEDEDFDTNRLCRELALSRSQLFRKLKALTNTSTAIYIRKVRLQKANELLHQTQRTVSEIAFDVGFKDVAYFSRCFSEEFGISPSATRR